MFSERLRALRKERKISQGALAAQLGISQQAVGKWETGRSTPFRSSLRPEGAEVLVPVLGTVKAGYDAYAFEEDYGSEPANVKNPRDYFYLIVRGDSMEPRISSGDLALVHSQPDVESGDLAVVLVDGEEGTLKKVLKKEGAVILQPFNPAYQTQVFIGGEIGRLTIVGKVVETKTKW